MKIILLKLIAVSIVTLYHQGQIIGQRGGGGGGVLQSTFGDYTPIYTPTLQALPLAYFRMCSTPMNIIFAPALC